MFCSDSPSNLLIKIVIFLHVFSSFHTHLAAGKCQVDICQATKSSSQFSQTFVIESRLKIEICGSHGCRREKNKRKTKTEWEITKIFEGKMENRKVELRRLKINSHEHQLLKSQNRWVGRIRVDTFVGEKNSSHSRSVHAISMMIQMALRNARSTRLTGERIVLRKICGSHAENKVYKYQTWEGREILGGSYARRRVIHENYYIFRIPIFFRMSQMFSSVWIPHFHVKSSLIHLVECEFGRINMSSAVGLRLMNWIMRKVKVSSQARSMRVSSESFTSSTQFKTLSNLCQCHFLIFSLYFVALVLRAAQIGYKITRK